MLLKKILKSGSSLGSDGDASIRSFRATDRAQAAGGADAGRMEPVRTALHRCRSAFIGLGIFSCLTNLLMLTGPLFMMQVYDRVLTSGSLPTLVALVGLVTLLYLFYGLLELVRSRILIRVGRRMDEQLSPAAFRSVLDQPLRPSSGDGSSRPVRDLDSLRQFFSGKGPLALFDLPWVPLYLAILFLFHPLLGLVAATGAAILFLLTVLSETSNRKPVGKASSMAARRNGFAASCRRNAEAIHAMGMGRQLGRMWGDLNGTYLDLQDKVGDKTGLLSTITRTIRLLMQSIILAAGAWLAVIQEISPGTIIAGSIIMSRALAPIEMAVSHWRGFIAARQGANRLNATLGRPAPIERTDLPRPSRSLELSNVTVMPPGSQKIAVERISFALRAGDGLGIIGPSASGKSALARVIVGVWPMVFGGIRLDGASLDQWDPVKLGCHVGYLPQAVDLFDGTITENIARFDPARTSELVLEAAAGAGVHEMILNLPGGYDTNIGEGGSVLSCGQRQRIGLARALYRKPFLIVLDEPNSNLDVEGEAALADAIRAQRRGGAIVIVIAHRPNVIASVNHLLVMSDGRQKTFGRPQDVLNRKVMPVAANHGPLEPGP
jgi:ATP-binding cassette subfamily C protein